MSIESPSVRTVQVTRYVTPLREGGFLPAIAEADDEFLYVLKFRGAGQGVKSLVAELIGGEIARLLGMKVPEIVFATLDPAFGRSEPDEEIQDLLKASVGLNLGLHYLTGSITYDPAVTAVDALTASRIVWLDSLLTNVDRTARNTNMLFWNKELWLIDHGAALYFHHSSDGIANVGPSADTTSSYLDQSARRPFTQIKDHVLLPWASRLDEVDQAFRAILTPDRVNGIVALLPDEWLVNWPSGQSPDAAPSPREIRDVYARFLNTRIGSSSIFVNEAQNVRKNTI
ncbi:HipA family kinase [Puia sp. P3]|uniref:HipA family kinase n=1 Tax=Puia sp. P3 TaxID=3423952 RepID=UPI003D678F9C